MKTEPNLGHRKVSLLPLSSVTSEAGAKLLTMYAPEKNVKQKSDPAARLGSL
jgi:hypothetical protein